MYDALTDFLIRLSAQGVVWSISVILAMAVTAVVLYAFWDLVGRAVSLVRPGARNRGGAGGRRSARGH